MAKILYVWEVGAGSGHITPYVKLISRLQEKGHEIGFVLTSVHKANDFFHGSGVKWYQGPSMLPRYVNLVRPNNSYPKILHNIGYDKVSRLSGMIEAWRNLFELIDPDLMVFDYSPTAMLASRDMKAARIAIGTGFHLPPDIKPIPAFMSKRGDKRGQNELLKFENKVLGTINEALALNGLKPLSCFSELLDADKKILRTFAEMDHYGRREDATYVGVLKSPPGEIPEWPPFDGPKIFAYLKPFKTLPKLFETLNRKRYPTLVYGDKIPQKMMRNAASETLKFVDKPQDMGTIGQQADAVICNAGHGTTTEMLLSGVPLLLLPLYAEQLMVAQNVERLGAGLSAPKRVPERMEDKLDKILNMPNFRESAKKFALSYSGFKEENLLKTILETIDSYLPAK